MQWVLAPINVGATGVPVSNLHDALLVVFPKQSMASSLAGAEAGGSE